jgi:hypothetical protein
MAKKHQKDQCPTGQRGAAEEAGASFDPGQLPDEEASQSAPTGGAVPLGLPISAEEYERLQREAHHRKLPPKRSGQEDASA